MVPFRVLVVDDSAFMRRVVTDLLQSDGQLCVVDTARDGLEAVAKAGALRPDVITMDVEMPRLDGLGALCQIMAVAPTPVVMVSSLTQRGADATIQALAAGAVDFVPKPSGAVSLDLHRVRDELVRKVKVAAQSRVAAVGGVAAPPSHLARPTATGRLSRLIIVAASTGGPGALLRLLTGLQPGLRAGLLIVQHMPAGFTRSLAAHLDQVSPLPIREAAAGDALVDGLGLVAPGGQHLLVTPDRQVRLDSGPARNGVRPAADVTLESIPPQLAACCQVVVLTGMGMDGARGARYLQGHGARVWAQDADSCVVFGMPRAVVELGLAARTGPPEQLAAGLVEWAGGGGIGDGRVPGDGGVFAPVRGRPGDVGPAARQLS